jgi:hypothetical protein
MRLGQLARKLSLRPSQIADYLAGRQVFPEEGVNAKLSDELTEEVIRHFAPDRINEIMMAEERDLPESNLVTEADIISEPNESRAEAEVVIENKPEIPEVIKAPKIELSGLKVLGKIELKEPNKKGEPEKENQTKTERTNPIQAQKKFRKDSASRKSPEKPWKNPVVQQREKEAREAEARRREEAAREKERRTQNYYKRVKQPPPTKAAKVFDEPVETFSEPSQPQPRTWLGRFLRWLNS